MLCCISRLSLWYHEYKKTKKDCNGNDQKISMDSATSSENSSRQGTIRFNWIPNDYEVLLLRATWRRDDEFLFQIGSKIYEYIFKHNAHTRKLFPGIHQHGDHWRESPEFRDLAMKFAQTINMCIHLLDTPHKIISKLRMIGDRHVQFAVRGFKPEYWNIFYDALDVALEVHLSSLDKFDEKKFREAKDAWRKLACFIVKQMKTGYVRRLRQLAKTV